MERRPASAVIVTLHYKKFLRKGQGRAAEATEMLMAPAVELPIERGVAGPSLLADTIVRRWQDHQPLSRLEDIYNREKVGLPKSTICTWHEYLAELVRPVVDAMFDDAYRQPYLCVDATGVLVLAKGKCRNAHFWLLVAPEKHVLYGYSRSHDGKAVDQLLGSASSAPGPPIACSSSLPPTGSRLSSSPKLSRSCSPTSSDASRFRRRADLAIARHLYALAQVAGRDHDGRDRTDTADGKTSYQAPDKKQIRGWLAAVITAHDRNTAAHACSIDAVWAGYECVPRGFIPQARDLCSRTPNEPFWKDDPTMLTCSMIDSRGVCRWLDEHDCVVQPFAASEEGRRQGSNNVHDVCGDFDLENFVAHSLPIRSVLQCSDNGIDP